MTEIVPENGQAKVTRIDSFRDRPERAPAKSKGRTSQEIAPLVEPGEYAMVYVTRFTTYVHKTPKLAIRFRIVEHGECFGIELERWFNCKRLIGKPGKNGGFMPPRHGGFLIEYCTLFPLELTRNSRLDRVSFKPFKNSIIVGKVKTVKRNSQQRNIPEPLQYSTIKELLRASNDF